MPTYEEDGVVSKVTRGPMPKYGEKMVKITFRLQRTHRELLKKVMKRTGKTQDELIRDSIEELLCRADLL